MEAVPGHLEQQPPDSDAVGCSVLPDADTTDTDQYRDARPCSSVVRSCRSGRPLR